MSKINQSKEISGVLNYVTPQDSFFLKQTSINTEEKVMREFLKIKVTSLAEEIKQIRAEERKAKRIERSLADPFKMLAYWKKRQDRLTKFIAGRQPLPLVNALQKVNVREQVELWEKRVKFKLENPHKNDRIYNSPFWGLRAHRNEFVWKYHTREANIAYAFLRGRSYAEIEPYATTLPNWAKVQGFVDKFGANVSNVRPFNVWRVEAEIHWNTQAKKAEAA